MIYHSKPGQIMYGQSIGILLLEQVTPYIPGDVANATSYDFPVRYEIVPGFKVEKVLALDDEIYESLRDTALQLQSQGVRAITGDCGFMGFHQKRLASELNIPVFLSSLIQIPFITRIISPGKYLGVVTANSSSFNDSLLDAMDILNEKDRIRVCGLEDQPAFVEFGLRENGSLDTEKVEQEVVTAAVNMIEEDPAIGAILLECSLLPPYGAAVHKATGLPVFDFITMINFVHSAVVKQGFVGHM